MEPEQKSHKVIISVVVIIVLVVLGIWWFTGNERKADNLNKDQTGEQLTTDQNTINAKRAFIDGTHTLVGQIDLPTPCDLLDYSVAIAESVPEQVAINFIIINESEGACAQVITPARFKVTFAASAEAIIGATLNGVPVILNIIEAAEDENLDDFEIYIKG